MGADRRVTGAYHHHIGFNFIGQFIDHIAHVAKADVHFDSLRVNAEMAGHRFQARFCFMLQMLFKAAQIGGKTTHREA